MTTKAHTVQLDAELYQALEVLRLEKEEPDIETTLRRVVREYIAPPDEYPPETPLPMMAMGERMRRHHAEFRTTQPAYALGISPSVTSLKGQDQMVTSATPPTATPLSGSSGAPVPTSPGIQIDKPKRGRPMRSESRQRLEFRSPLGLEPELWEWLEQRQRAEGYSTTNQVVRQLIMEAKARLT